MFPGGQIHTSSGRRAQVREDVGSLRLGQLAAAVPQRRRDRVPHRGQLGRAHGWAADVSSSTASLRQFLKRFCIAPPAPCDVPYGVLVLTGC